MQPTTKFENYGKEHKTMKVSTLNWTGRVMLIGALSVLLGGDQVRAALIPGFPIPEPPDFYSEIGSVTYDATTDAFEALGTPQNFIRPDLSEVNDFLSSPTPIFSILADITSTGAIGGGGGSLSITGKSISLGNANTNLLSGVLEQFGFTQVNANSGRFEFVFGSLTGIFAPYYASGKAYALVTAGHSGADTDMFNGTFTSDFSFTGSSAVDTFGQPVPEPATATLAGLALAAFMAMSRLRRR